MSDGSRGFINTVKGKLYDQVSETFIVPKSFSFTDEDSQPYIYDKTTNITIKLAKKGEDPHGIMISSDFRYPIEKICVKDAYDGFNSWGENPIMSTDWYKTPNEDKVY